MTQNDQNHEPLDIKLIELLKQLPPPPPRDPGAAVAGKSKFLAEVDSITSSWSAIRGRFLGWFSPNHHHQEGFTMYRKPQLAISVLLIFVLSLVFLLGGAGATALAAQSALPGDALYSVKTGLEQTRLSIAANAYSRGQLHLEFAQRRLDEIARLIAEGRFRDIGQAADAFEAELQKAIDALQVVTNNDPSRSGELARQIASALSKYADVLSTLAASAPDPARPEVEKALRATLTIRSPEMEEQGEFEFTGVIESISQGMWKISGQDVEITSQTEIKGILQVGDMVKVHAQAGDNGALIAREIELANAGEDVDNENGNENVNENVNNNENMNEDLNENENENLNENENENENINENMNENLNENENDNDDVNEDRGEGEVRFIGIVESIASRTWVVSGRSLSIVPQTEIRDSVSEGDLVEVRSTLLADGSLVALRIELAENGGISNANHNDNEEGIVNGNMNGVEDDRNENGENSNSISNENDNDNDDQHDDNSNENANLNENHNENENDGHNGNGGGDD